MEKKRLILKASIALTSMTVLVIAYWLTRFRYDKLVQTTTRTNIWTGSVEFLTEHGWRKATDPIPETPPKVSLRDRMQMLPDAEYNQMECTASISAGRLTVTLYNKSKWNICEMMVHVDVIGSDPAKPRISRDFIVTADSPVGWLQTGKLTAFVGDEVEPRQLEKLEWKWMKVAGFID